MDLGTFSVSLAVKDIDASRRFYEALGFETLDNQAGENWAIMQHGNAIIGLFQGMFEENILTFNPEDIRAVQRRLKEEGLVLINEADESGDGPGHAILADPDGNVILLDQLDVEYEPSVDDQSGHDDR